MGTSHKVAPAIQEYLEDVKSQVAEVKDPSGNSIRIPNYPDLYDAAGKLDTTENPIRFMNIIHSLLGRARNIGSETISFNEKGPEYNLKFPEDHRMHGSMGDEWYWIGCHLNVTDNNNNKGKLSILDTMQKIRSMGTDTQAKHGWTEEQVCVTCNIATITTIMDDGETKNYYRRRTNEQWPLKAGQSSFSSEGEPFSFKVGPDSFTGSNNVLPLKLFVDDGDNMQINIIFRHTDNLNLETSFFRQGVPIPGGNGGTGITPLPRPGIYYSWPQVTVTGTVSVGGRTYKVNSGTGWIDHQLMMPSILDSKGKPDPLLYARTSKNHPYDGWLWQYYNLENGTSFTGAGFLQGEIPTDNIIKMVYGYFLEPNKQKGWDAVYIMGDQLLEDPQTFPSICDYQKSKPVTIPIQRRYDKLTNLLNWELLFHPISGHATPWYRDGSFNNPDQSFCAEFPADFVSQTKHHPNGVGYLESVGFEKGDEHRSYALGVLKGFVLGETE